MILFPYPCVNSHRIAKLFEINVEKLAYKNTCIVCIKISLISEQLYYLYFNKNIT